MTEKYYTSLDSYNKSRASGNTLYHVWAVLPSAFYGHTGGYTAYDLDAPLSSDTYSYRYSIAVEEGFSSNDIIQTTHHADDVYGGLGDDYLNGRFDADLLVGGNGDDTLVGASNRDVLLGDWADFPVIISSKEWDVPSENAGVTGNDVLYGGDDSDIIVGGSGDDRIDGGEGADIIDGGDGNDQISAGPRGDGDLDDVTGGRGADLFLLDYSEATDPPSAAATFWRDFGTPGAQAIGKDFVKTGIQELGKAGLSAALGEIPQFSGLLLGPLGGVAGAAASEGIGLLFAGLSKSPQPSSSEDVLVIRDFDPREDVIMLPIDATKSLSSVVRHYDNSAVNGNSTSYIDLDDDLSGYALSFEVAGRVYAQVFLAEDYLEALGIFGPSDVAERSLNNIVLTETVIDQNGVVGADSAFTFSNDTPDWKAPAGTKITVFGALGPMVIRGADQDGLTLGGSNFGDIITANATLLAPEDTLNSFDVTLNDAILYGFGGDDYLYGGNGRDKIFGGDDDDYLYAFSAPPDNANGNLYNQLYGDDGNDVLVAGSGTSAMYGGSGTDLVSYELSPNGVTVNLGATPDFRVKPHNFTNLDHSPFTGFATGYSAYDILASIEGVIGSDFDDVVNGSGHHDYFTPGRGNDTFNAGAGADYLDYSDQAAKVVADLAAGTTQKFDGGFTDTFNSVSGVTGSAFDDTLLGHGGNSYFFYSAGNDAIDGRLGTDGLYYANSTGPVNINVGTGHTVKYDIHTGGAVGTDTFSNIEFFKGSGFDDVIVGGSFASSASVAATSMAPEAFFAVGKAQPFTFHGGKGKDTVVFDGGVGDARIARDLSKVVSGGLKAELKKIEMWQFDDYVVEAHRFDAALTNLAGKLTVRGDEGHELLVGHKSGHDRMIGAEGRDALLGLGGDDLLLSGRGKDHLDGGDGNDRLKGHDGNDSLKGGNGDDRLNGGHGRNTLEGGEGVDTYVVHADGKKADIIFGYEQGESIVIHSDVLAGLVGGSGPLDASYFHVGENGAGRDHHVILDLDRGRLLFDANGNDAGGVSVLAKFRNGALPDVGDIVVA